MSTFTRMLRERGILPVKDNDRFGAIPREEFMRSMYPTPNPSVGVVIGTYGSPAYIALQLEARRRFWPQIPTLVHDDHSPDEDRLRAMCAAAGVDFATTRERYGWSLGDMAAIVGGFDWARSRGLEVLVKVSRRLLLHHDWVPAFQQLCHNSNYITYTGFDTRHNIPFRSECMGMHVEGWHASGAVEELRGHAARGKRVHPKIETFYQQLALRIQYSHASPTLEAQEVRFRRDPSWEGYAPWPMLGPSRVFRAPGVMWHDVHSAEDYFRQALAWGLEGFSAQDFGVENLDESIRAESETMAARNPDFEIPKR